MTDCTPYIDDLKAYADAELPWLRRQIVRRHLAHCAFCQKEIIAMTQITDDLRSDNLRSSEPGEPLPAGLREKLLKEPSTESAGLLANESRSATKDSSVPGKKRRTPVWVYACVVLIAWFVFYPMFQRVHEDAQRTMSVADFSAPHENEIKVFKRPPPKPVPLQVHLSDREAGIDNHAAKEDYAPPAARAALPVPTAPIGNFTAQTPDGAAPARRAAQIAGLNSLQALPDTDLDVQRQVHKEASIGIQVPNPEATGDKINQMVQETGGFVAANNLTTEDDGMKSGELIAKVPEPQFETFLAQIAKLGVVVSKNITGQDITEKTSDAHEAQGVEESDLEQAEARLKALGTHAKWEDKEDTQDLRVQLAQTRARLKLLKRMAALGTITIDLNQTPKAAAAPPVPNGFTGSLKATTHDALQSLVGSASALAALVIWLLAYAPLWVPLLLVGRYALNRYALKEYKKREATN